MIEYRIEATLVVQVDEADATTVREAAVDRYNAARTAGTAFNPIALGDMSLLRAMSVLCSLDPDPAVRGLRVRAGRARCVRLDS